MIFETERWRTASSSDGLSLLTAALIPIVVEMRWLVLWMFVVACKSLRWFLLTSGRRKCAVMQVLMAWSVEKELSFGRSVHPYLYGLTDLCMRVNESDRTVWRVNVTSFVRSPETNRVIFPRLYYETCLWKIALFTCVCVSMRVCLSLVYLFNYILAVRTTVLVCVWFVSYQYNIIYFVTITYLRYIDYLYWLMAITYNV